MPKYNKTLIRCNYFLNKYAKDIYEIDDFLKTEHEPRPIDWKELGKGLVVGIFLGLVIILYLVANN